MLLIHYIPVLPHQARIEAMPFLNTV